MYYEKGLEHLQNNYIEHVFDRSKSYVRWSYATWAQALKPVIIKERGTERDCKRLADRIKSDPKFSLEKLTASAKHELEQLEQGVAPKAKKRRTHNTT